MAVDLEDPRQAQYLGWLLCAASLEPPGLFRQTAIRCRRRPGRRPCPGTMRVMLTEVPDRMHWQCSRCGEEGSIGAWRHNIWNLRDWVAGKDPEPHDVELTVSEEEYRILREAIHGPCVVVGGGKLTGDGRVRLRGDLGDLEDFLLALGEAPALGQKGRRARLLADVTRRVRKARIAAASPSRERAREIASALADGEPPDERVRGLLRQLAASLPVPFDARLGAVEVSVDTVTFWDGDLPELRARTTFRGDRIELNLGALRVETGAAAELVGLYRDWWMAQEGGRRRDRGPR